MNNYKIEKDKILGCYIVWEVHKNYMVDVCHRRLKRECKEFLKGKAGVQNA